jgi:hypothetical protein
MKSRKGQLKPEEKVDDMGAGLEASPKVSGYSDPSEWVGRMYSSQLHKVLSCGLTKLQSYIAFCLHTAK